MKIKDIIVEAELSPARQAALDKIARGVTTSPEEREKRYRDEEKRKAAEKPDPEAERAKRKAETDKIIAFAKKNGYDLEPQDVNAFMRGVDDGKHGKESRRAGDTEGPHYSAYFHGTQIGRKMQVNEMSASSVAAVATPVGGMISRQMKNKDGTVKNALDMDTNIMGQKKKSKRKKT